MSISLIVHLANEEPFVAEVDAMPDLTHRAIVLSNPRKPDGRDLHYLADEVTVMIVPWHRVSFLEVVPSTDAEDIIGFVRE